MRLIDRYIIREVAGIFIFGVAVFTSLLLVNHLFYLARLAAEAGIPVRTSLMLLLLRVPFLASYSLPMSILLATLLAFGRLSDRNEIAAMRTTGWSLSRVARPVLLAGMAVAGLSFGLTEYVVPRSERRYLEAVAQAIRAPSHPIQYNVLFRESVDDVESVFYARELDIQKGIMSDVTITQFQQGRPSRLIEAERARYGLEGWVLERGTLYLLGSNGVTTKFDEMRVALKRAPPEIVPPRRDPAEMTISELRAQIARLQALGESFLRYAVSLQLKFAVPVSSVIFALLAVPLGLRPHRSGRSTGLGLTVLVLLGYYVILSITVTLGERGQLPPVWAAWLPNITVAATACYLLWTAR